MPPDHAFKDRYFEDNRVGEVVELGSVTISDADIIAFARAHNPQAFHVDPEAARASPYGGLIASAWHTGSLMMRMMVDHSSPGTASDRQVWMSCASWPLCVPETR